MKLEQINKIKYTNPIYGSGNNEFNDLLNLWKSKKEITANGYIELINYIYNIKDNIKININNNINNTDKYDYIDENVVIKLKEIYDSVLWKDEYDIYKTMSIFLNRDNNYNVYPTFLIGRGTDSGGLSKGISKMIGDEIKKNYMSNVSKDVKKIVCNNNNSSNSTLPINPVNLSDTQNINTGEWLVVGGAGKNLDNISNNKNIAIKEDIDVKQFDLKKFMVDDYDFYEDIEDKQYKNYDFKINDKDKIVYNKTSEIENMCKILYFFTFTVSKNTVISKQGPSLGINFSSFTVMMLFNLFINVGEKKLLSSFMTDIIKYLFKNKYIYSNNNNNNNNKLTDFGNGERNNLTDFGNDEHNNLTDFDNDEDNEEGNKEPGVSYVGGGNNAAVNYNNNYNNGNINRQKNNKNNRISKGEYYRSTSKECESTTLKYLYKSDPEKIREIDKRIEKYIGIISGLNEQIDANDLSSEINTLKSNQCFEYPLVILLSKLAYNLCNKEELIIFNKELDKVKGIYIDDTEYNLFESNGFLFSLSIKIRNRLLILEKLGNRFREYTDKIIDSDRKLSFMSLSTLIVDDFKIDRNLLFNSISTFYFPMMKEILGEMSDDELRYLFVIITGTSNQPSKLSFMFEELSEDKLLLKKTRAEYLLSNLSSHTCFNRLDLLSDTSFKFIKKNDNAGVLKDIKDYKSFIKAQIYMLLSYSGKGDFSLL